MISIALATALMAATPQGGGAPLAQARRVYGSCLSLFVRNRVKDKLDKAGFSSGVKTACTSEEAAFRSAVIADEMKTGVKRAEAERDAVSQVEDYIANSADTYAGYVTPD